MSHTTEKIIDYLDSHPELYSGKKVIDAGGGYGGFLNHLQNASFRVLVDIDLNKLKQAEYDVRVLADINYLPFKDDTFDLGLFTEVFEHLETPKKAVEELYRTCKKIFLTTANNSLARRIFWKIRGKKPLSSIDHVREYSVKEVVDHFEGFTLKDKKPIGFIIMKPYFLRHLEISTATSCKMLLVLGRTSD